MKKMILILSLCTATIHAGGEPQAITYSLKTVQQWAADIQNTNTQLNQCLQSHDIASQSVQLQLIDTKFKDVQQSITQFSTNFDAKKAVEVGSLKAEDAILISKVLGEAITELSNTQQLYTLIHLRQAAQIYKNQQEEQERKQRNIEYFKAAAMPIAAACAGILFSWAHDYCMQ